MALYNKGEELFKKQKYQQAINIYLQCIQQKLAPLYSLQLRISQSLLQLKQYQKAYNYACECMDNNEQCYEAYFIKIDAGIILKKPDCQILMLFVRMKKLKFLPESKKKFVEEQIKKYTGLLKRTCIINDVNIQQKSNSYFLQAQNRLIGNQNVENLDKIVENWHKKIFYYRQNFENIWKKYQYTYGLNLSYLLMNQYPKQSDEYNYINDQIKKRKQAQLNKLNKQQQQLQKMDEEKQQDCQVQKITQGNLIQQLLQTKGQLMKSQQINKPIQPIQSIQQQKQNKQLEETKSKKIENKQSNYQFENIKYKIDIQNMNSESIMQIYLKLVQNSSDKFQSIMACIINILKSNFQIRIKNNLIQIIMEKWKMQFKYFKFTQLHTQQVLKQLLQKHNMNNLINILCPKCI